jgi:hypothetical protein
VSDLIISIAAMFFSLIGIVACIIYHNVPSLIIFLCFSIYCIVERIRKKRKQKQIHKWNKESQYSDLISVECCCEDCIYFTNVIHHADGRKVGLCELHNRYMYTYSFCFSAKKKRGDVK